MSYRPQPWTELDFLPPRGEPEITAVGGHAWLVAVLGVLLLAQLADEAISNTN